MESLCNSQEMSTENLNTKPGNYQDRKPTGHAKAVAPSPNTVNHKGCLLKLLLVFLCSLVVSIFIILAVFYLGGMKEKERNDTPSDNVTSIIQEYTQLTTSFSGLNSDCSVLYKDGLRLKKSIEKIADLYSNLTWKYFSLYSARDRHCPIFNPSTQEKTCYVCPEKWHLFNDRCYLFTSRIRDWNSSRDYCVSIGRQLAIIESEEEQKFLEEKVRTLGHPEDYWIGLKITEGEFRWVDNKLLETKISFWVQRPSIYKGQSCVYLGSDLRSHGWLHSDCGEVKRWICEGPCTKFII
ncbi:C-type lectin domain family 4 member E-like isoform X1 [Polypterus senegalus]|uniref:C-type lectin domain family 4 member E-like isoform X1 n=1 Tax=Polypterus senegalus TaxID=55291 RepID=UPI001963CF6A|nr:C-type lectin domain family 4 member E-like isoform X1 [Polypterus senegalus]